MQHVDWCTADGGYQENVQALYDAFEAAKAVTDKPSFIVLHTIIGWPAPTKQGTGAAHGAALGADEVAATKEILGFDPAVKFPVEEEALARAREVAERGKAVHAEWDEEFKSWEERTPNGPRSSPGWPRTTFPRGGRTRCRSSRPIPRASATRKASGEVLPRSRRCCPSCGAARPTWPSPT